MLGTTEVVVIVLVVLVLFGAKKIPEFARGLGKGLKEFKNAKDDIKDTIDDNKIQNVYEIYGMNPNLNIDGSKFCFLETKV